MVSFRFTYAINTAAIIFAATGEMSFWDVNDYLMSIVMFVITPICLVLINSLGVEVCLSPLASSLLLLLSLSLCAEAAGSTKTNICRYMAGSKSWVVF